MRCWREKFSVFLKKPIHWRGDSKNLTLHLVLNINGEVYAFNVNNPSIVPDNRNLGDEVTFSGPGLKTTEIPYSNVMAGQGRVMLVLKYDDMTSVLLQEIAINNNSDYNYRNGKINVHSFF